MESIYVMAACRSSSILRFFTSLDEYAELAGAAPEGKALKYLFLALSRVMS